LLNAADGGAGERRWNDAGRPVVPALVVDGRTVPVLHVSQIAEALGLPPPPGGAPAREGAEAAALLALWIERLRGQPWEALLEPTPARGRTVRNLTVNVFHPFELLPTAWRDGAFPWHPEQDAVRERRLPDHDALLSYARSALATWQAFLDEDAVGDSDPLVDSPRGPVRFSTLVGFQRWHAAYHYRQVVHVLGGELPALDGLVLPREVF
jgi:hypothetical protein